MSRVFSRYVALISLAIMAGCQGASTEARPRYVFLFIGDGMGPVQRQVGDIAARKSTGAGLKMEQMPIRGQIHTRSADSAVTDSAAAGTALAAGVKTNNGMLGVAPDGKDVESICTALARDGMKIGLISSVQLNHATPAAFYCHAGKRGSYDDIAAQVAGCGADLLIGNGLLSDSSKQNQFITDWKAAGMTVVTSLDQAAAADPSARMVGVLNFPDAGKEKLDAQAGLGQLASAVKLAIDRLDNPRGFFLMVEGGKIDFGGHANSAAMAIDETLAMDRAIEVALEFYRQRPDDTLIIVTADHETGGMRLDQSRLDLDRLMQLPAMQSALSAAIGDIESATPTSVQKAISDSLGLGSLSDEELAPVERAMKSDMKKRKANVVLAAMNIAQARAGIKWTTTGHTGVDVPVTAIGAGSAAFAGTYDNTQIPARLRKLCAGAQRAPARTPATAPSTAPGTASASRELAASGR